MKRAVVIVILLALTGSVGVGLSGCGRRWPISPEHAKAVVRTCIAPRFKVSRVRAGRVTQGNVLAPGRDAYSITIEFADASGQYKQTWAVDAVTGQAFPPDLSAVDTSAAEKL